MLRARSTCAAGPLASLPQCRQCDSDPVTFETAPLIERPATPVDVKTGAGRRAVPMAFVIRRELNAHQQRTNLGGADLVFGRTATEAFFTSTIRARANKAWEAAGLQPITPHEARHCAISYFIAAGPDWKQISTWAGHGDVRQTWNRYGHLVPGGEEAAGDRLDAYLNPPNLSPTVAETVAHEPNNQETPVSAGVLEYRYRDSNFPRGTSLRNTQSATTGLPFVPTSLRNSQKRSHRSPTVPKLSHEHDPEGPEGPSASRLDGVASRAWIRGKTATQMLDSARRWTVVPPVPRCLLAGGLSANAEAQSARTRRLPPLSGSAQKHY